MTLAINDVDRRHDHAGRAEAALQAMMFTKRLLHRMQRRAVGGKPFDRPDLVSVRHDRKCGAGFDRLAIEVHDTGAALGGVAADMGAREPQIFTQELHQEGTGIDIGVDGITVHDQGYFGHSALSSAAALHGSTLVKIDPNPSYGPSRQWATSSRRRLP